MDGTDTGWVLPVRRVPLPMTVSGKTASYFLPGLGVDATSGGATARLALVYYDYLDNSCGNKNNPCQLYTAFTQSVDGGLNWTVPARLGGPMPLTWIVNTSQGRMVGDYFASSYTGGAIRPIFALASDPTGTGFAFNQAIYTAIGLMPAAFAPTLAAYAEPEPLVASRLVALDPTHPKPSEPLKRRRK